MIFIVHFIRLCGCTCLFEAGSWWKPRIDIQIIISSYGRISPAVPCPLGHHASALSKYVQDAVHLTRGGSQPCPMSIQAHLNSLIWPLFIVLFAPLPCLTRFILEPNRIIYTILKSTSKPCSCKYNVTVRKKVTFKIWNLLPIPVQLWACFFLSLKYRWFKSIAFYVCLCQRTYIIYGSNRSMSSCPKEGMRSK